MRDKHVVTGVGHDAVAVAVVDVEALALNVKARNLDVGRLEELDRTGVGGDDLGGVARKCFDADPRIGGAILVGHNNMSLTVVVVAGVGAVHDEHGVAGLQTTDGGGDEAQR